VQDLAYQRCLNHTFREAVARCPECGHYFCRECITEHEDRVVCASCLRKLVESSAGGRAALGVSVLFLWMKCWQTVFACTLKAHVCGEPPPRWTLRRINRLAFVQTVIQPSLLFVMPFAMLVVLPIGWVHALYHSVTVIGDGETASAKTVFKTSWQQSMLWQRQNHIALSIVSLLGLFVFINVFITVLIVPDLARSLLGVETVFSRAGSAAYNTTLWAVALGVTYLCINPLTHALYVLRCFYGASLATGADLKAELRNLAPPSRIVSAALVVLLAVCAAFCISSAAGAQESDPQTLDIRPAHRSVSPFELERTISEVIQQREYAWRMPREKPPRGEGWLAEFVDSIVRMAAKWFKQVVEWIGDVVEWIVELIVRLMPSPGAGGTGAWEQSARVLIIALLAIAAGALAVTLIQAMRSRRARREEVMAEPVLLEPDLADENLVADELPADGWLTIAQNLLGKGELRLALRAFYLASLAYLAHREMITIAKFKSNREYERELRRRAPMVPDVLTAFSQNVTAFERSWYGLHEVTHTIMSRFRLNLERIRACGQE